MQGIFDQRRKEHQTIGSIHLYFDHLRNFLPRRGVKEIM